VVDEDGIVVS